MRSRRLVSFAGATVEVIARDPAAAALSRFIFERFPLATPGKPCLYLELVSDGPATFALWRDGSLVYRRTGAAPAARLLLAEAVHSLSVNCRQDILLHAAAVASAGRGFLLPGPSGAGKSTLAAWLDHHGFACLSDEIVGVSAVEARLLAFPRPICLEPDAQVVLRDVLDLARGEGRVLEAEGALLVAPRCAVPPGPVPLARIVFPRYIPQARTTLRPLSQAAAAIGLLGSVANGRSRSDGGFAEVGNFVRRVPACELRHGDLDGCAEAILQALATDPTGVDAGGSDFTA